MAIFVYILDLVDVNSYLLVCITGYFDNCKKGTYTAASLGFYIFIKVISNGVPRNFTYHHSKFDMITVER